MHRLEGRLELASVREEGEMVVLMKMAGSCEREAIDGDRMAVGGRQACLGGGRVHMCEQGVLRGEAGGRVRARQRHHLTGAGEF